MMNKEGKLDIIPNDIILDIFLRFSAKSIGRFRCLSKLWSSILGRPSFTELFLTRSSNHPRLLFGVKKYGKWLFFSAPQPQNLYEKSSFLAVSADIHIEFSRDVSQYIDSCSYSSSLIYFCDMCIQKEKTGARPVLCNPITGQYAILPKLTMDGERKSFLGFDHINKQFKVLLINKMIDSEGWEIINYHILTVGIGQMRWSKIQCPLAHKPFGKEICINGVLYYLAQPTNGTSVVIGCFDVRFEKFKFIEAKWFIDAKWFSESWDALLINYKGKLGRISWNKYYPLCMWVLEDVEKQEWSKHVYTFPMNYSCSLSLSGVTAKGDIVFKELPTSKPFSVFYLNPEREIFQRIEIHGNYEVFDSHDRVYTFVDHVEVLEFNFMKKTYAATSISPPDQKHKPTSSATSSRKYYQVKTVAYPQQDRRTFESTNKFDALSVLDDDEVTGVKT